MTRTSLLRQAFERVRPHMTPRLLVIGAQKAGTSALFSMLAKHPKAAPPVRKELDFFNDDAAYAKGMRYYRSLFPPIPATSFGHFTFEASPSYLYHAERCAPRIAKDLPGVTCVAILRDPVKRAYSAWNMFRAFKGHPLRGHLHDPRSFRQAVEDELAGRTLHAYHMYLARGLYAAQLAHFAAVVPNERLLVFNYTELKKQPHEVLRRLCAQLGIAEIPASTNAGQVKSHVVGYNEPLDPGLATELYRYFANEPAQLQQVLGRSIDLFEAPMPGPVSV